MASFEEMNEWALRALVAAAGEGASVRLVAAQNRHAGEEEPSWTLRVETTIHGAVFTVENDGPDLFEVIRDAWAAFYALGIDIEAENERLRPEFEARQRALDEEQRMRSERLRAQYKEPPETDPPTD